MFCQRLLMYTSPEGPAHAVCCVSCRRILRRPQQQPQKHSSFAEGSHTIASRSLISHLQRLLNVLARMLLPYIKI